jgi:hypothetical protein
VLRGVKGSGVTAVKGSGVTTAAVREWAVTAVKPRLRLVGTRKEAIMVIVIVLTMEVKVIVRVVTIEVKVIVKVLIMEAIVIVRVVTMP